MTDIESLTNRVIVIGHGKKLYDGSLSDIKKKYNRIKKVEIISNNLKKIPSVSNVEVIEKANGRVLLELNMDKTSISNVIREYSKLCEILDVNVYEVNIDNIIVNLYEEYNL
jgi:ABC-2 type transport system ATP-binding protein